MPKKSQQPPPMPPWRPGGFRLLADLPETVAGLIVWQAVRHLWLWLEASSARDAVFPNETPGWVRAKWNDARAEAPEIASQLEVIATELARRDIDVRRVACAFEHVREWAERRKFQVAAIELAEVGARLLPSDAKRANVAARMNRHAGEYGRAETWFDRAVALARLRGDRVEYTRGHLGAGILYMEVGRAGRARRHLNRAANYAMKYGYEWLAAEAQHDLFRFMTVRGDYDNATVHAQRAFRYYPKHHQRLPFFGADVAFLLISQRHYTVAAALLAKVFSLVESPGARTVIASLFARALAGAGRTKAYERMKMRVYRMLSRPSEWEAAARWNLAEAQRLAGDLEAAAREAQTALAVAEARLDAETAAFVQRLLTELDAGTPAPREAARPGPSIRTFLRTLSARLDGWAPTRRGRAPSLSRGDWAA